MAALAGNIAASRLSSMLRDSEWIAPTIQTVHILAIAVVVGSALVMELRLAGIFARDENGSAIVARYLPWLWRAVGVLLVSGLVMVIAEPERTLGNWVFWTKMLLVALAAALSFLFRRPLLDPSFAADRAAWAGLVKPMAWLFMAVWVAVIFCGRWIAYVY